jgi:uncharacterized protein
MADGNAIQWVQPRLLRLLVVAAALAGTAGLPSSQSEPLAYNTPALPEPAVQAGATDQTNSLQSTSRDQSQRLVEAIKRNDAKAVQELLEGGADPNTLDASGKSALVLAIAGGSVSIVRSLLAAGADLNRKCRDEQIQETTALCEASCEGSLELVKILLAAGGDVNATAGIGLMRQSPLMIAAMCDRPEVAREFLRAGAQVSIQDGGNALGAAASGGSEEIIEMLLDAGVDVDSPDWLGTTPLMEAASEGHVDTVKLLLARGADVNARDEAARREYGKADFVGDERTMRAIESSGSLAARHHDGASVLDIARLGGHLEVIRLLLSAGAK